MIYFSCDSERKSVIWTWDYLIRDCEYRKDCVDVNVEEKTVLTSVAKVVQWILCLFLDVVIFGDNCVGCLCS